MWMAMAEDEACGKAARIVVVARLAKGLTPASDGDGLLWVCMPFLLA